MMFVRWECGCVGLMMSYDGEMHHIVLNPCDGDRDVSFEMTWFERDMKGKKWQGISGNAAAALHKQISDRMVLSARFEQVRSALGI
jgi:hypothetical protein